MKILHFAVCLFILGLGAMGMARGNNYTYGEVQRMVNSYPPGGNHQLWTTDPSTFPQLDIRPFAGFYDGNLYCENDWHVLALAVEAYAFPPLDPNCKTDTYCVDTCYDCIFEKSINNAVLPPVIPFSSQPLASDWLNGLNPEFTLDGAPVEVSRSPVKAYVGGDFWYNDDGKTISGYGWPFGDALRAACSDECSSGFGLQVYAVQFSKIVSPAMEPEDPLLAGEHTLRVEIPNIFEDRDGVDDGFEYEVKIKVLESDKPECSQ